VGDAAGEVDGVCKVAKFFFATTFNPEFAVGFPGTAGESWLEAAAA
jgi:hypothetical protein